MATVWGVGPSVIGPTPGYPISGTPPPRRRGYAEREPIEEADDRDYEEVRLASWCEAVEKALKTEEAPMREEQEKALAFYMGEQYPEGRRRPRGKYRVRDNFIFDAVENWTAVLTDSKPRVTFAPLRPQDQWEADIAAAAFDDDFREQGYARRVESFVKLAAILKRSYLRIVPDSFGPDGKTVIRWIVVPSTQVWMDINATSIDDATIILYEYPESLGTVLGRFPELKGKVDRTMGPDMPYSSVKRLVPASTMTQTTYLSTTPGAVGQTSGAVVAQPPYSASDASMPSDTTMGVMVQEFWTRPRGPESQIHFDAPRWNFLNRPIVRPKVLDIMDDESGEFVPEPLQTVITEGSIVYELPMTVVAMFEAAQEFGGIKIVKVSDAMEVETQRKAFPLYPNGRRTIKIGKYIPSDGCNPYVHGDIPLIEYAPWFNAMSKTDRCITDEMIPMQEAYNDQLSRILNISALMGNPIWLIPDEEETPDEEFTNVPGLILRLSIPTLKFGRRESPPSIPPYMFQVLERLERRMEKKGGITELGTGGKYKGNQAAETVSMQQESQGTPFRKAQRVLDRCMERAGRQWLGLASQFYDEPRWVKLKNKLGIETYMPWIGTQLSAPLEIKARSGSGLPQQPSAKLQMLLSLLSTPAGDLHEFVNVLGELGVYESASSVWNRMQKAIAAFKQSGGQDPSSLIEFPGLLAALMGGAKKKNPGARTSRNKTPRSNG